MTHPMHLLLQPPPLIAILVVLSLVALAYRRLLARPSSRPGTDGILPTPSIAPPDEELEEWGDPGPQLVTREPFDYRRLDTSAAAVVAVEAVNSSPAAATATPAPATRLAPETPPAPETPLAPRTPPADEPALAVEPTLAEIFARAQRRRLPDSEGRDAG